MTTVSAAGPRAGAVGPVALLLLAVLLRPAAGAVPLPQQEGQGGTSRGELLSASLRADVERRGAAAVRVSYRLRVPPEAGSVPVEAVNFLGAEIREVSVRVDGEPAAFRRRSSDPRLLRGAVYLPRPSSGEDTLQVELAYRVSSALRGGRESFDLVLPVALVEWQPSSAPPGMFSAAVSMPSDFTVTKVFPTVARDIEDDGGERRLRLSLQVAPSLVRVSGVVGEAAFLTRGRIVDLAVGGLLLGLLALGVYRWRRTAGDGDGAGRGRRAGERP